MMFFFISYDQLLVVRNHFRSLVGRSPGSQILIKKPPSQSLSGIMAFILPVYSDEFAQVLHLFPFSPVWIAPSGTYNLR